MQVVCIVICTICASCATLKIMNDIQAKVLEIAETKDLGSITYYRLSKMLGVDHPYRVKYAIDKLIEKGLLTAKSDGSITKAISSGLEGLIKIPYYGEVNCGDATALAEDRIQSYLEISPSVIGAADVSNLFALKASGNSSSRIQRSISAPPVDRPSLPLTRIVPLESCAATRACCVVPPTSRTKNGSPDSRRIPASAAAAPASSRTRTARLGASNERFSQSR